MLPTTDPTVTDLDLGGGYTVILRASHQEGAFSASLRRGAGTYLGYHYIDSTVDPTGWATEWARKRIRAIEKQEAILEALGARAKAVATARKGSHRVLPDGATVAADSDLFGGAAVTIHAAGSWRRAVVNRATAKRVEVVWAAPSNGNLHIKSVPRGEVLA